MPSTKRAPKQEASSWIEDTIYCGATCSPEDIFYQGSEDEDYEDSTTRKLRYEAAGQRFLAGSIPYLISASLQGPFDKASGWSNPWKSRLRTRTVSATELNVHGSASSQQPQYYQSPVRQATGRLEVSDSLECHLPSPESLKQAALTGSHPFLEKDELAAVIHWRARVPNSDSPAEMLDQSDLTESQPHKKRTTSVSGIFEAPDRKKRRKSKLFSRSNAQEKSDARVSFHSTPALFDRGGEPFASPSLDMNVPGTFSAKGKDHISAQANAAATLSSPTSLLGAALASVIPSSPCKQTKKSRQNSGNTHAAGPKVQSGHPSSNLDISTHIVEDDAESLPSFGEGNTGPETQRDESFCYKLRAQVGEQSVSNTPTSRGPTSSALKEAIYCHGSDSGLHLEVSPCPNPKLQMWAGNTPTQALLPNPDEQAQVQCDEPETQDFQLAESSDNNVSMSVEENGSTVSEADGDEHCSSHSDNMSNRSGPALSETTTPQKEVGSRCPQHLSVAVATGVIDHVTDENEHDKNVATATDTPERCQTPRDDASKGSKNSSHAADGEAASPVPSIPMNESSGTYPNVDSNIDKVNKLLENKEREPITAPAREGEDAMINSQDMAASHETSTKGAVGDSLLQNRPQSPWSRTQPLNESIISTEKMKVSKEQTPSKLRSSPRPIPPEQQSPWVLGPEMALPSYAMLAPKFAESGKITASQNSTLPQEVNGSQPEIIPTTDSPRAERPSTPEPQFPVRSFASFMTPSPERASHRRQQPWSITKHTPHATHVGLPSALKNPWSNSRVVRRVSWAIMPQEDDQDTKSAMHLSPGMRPKREGINGRDRAMSPPPATIITPSMMEEVSEHKGSSFLKHFDRIAHRKTSPDMTSLASSFSADQDPDPRDNASISFAEFEAEPISRLSAGRDYDGEPVSIGEQEDAEMERPMDIVEDLFREIGDVLETWDLDTELAQAKNATQPRPSQLDAGLFGQ